MSLVGLSSQNPRFSPQDIPGLSLWLDAADSNTLTLSGSNVTAWRDKTGLNTTSTIVGSPTRITSALLNNLPAVRFNGSSDSLSYATFSLPQPLTVFAVTVQREASLAGYSFVLEPTASDGAGAVILYRSSPVTLFYWAGAGDVAAVPTVTYSSNITGVYSAVFNGASSFLGFNGQGTSNQNPGTLGWAGLHLGRDWAGVWQAQDVAEVLFYSSAFSTSQIQQVEGYLARKWGLLTNFPASHPYRSSVMATRAFSPLDVDGLSLWLDAADQTTLALSGSNVSQWRDKSGNGNNGTQGTTAQQPTYASNALSFVASSSTVMALPNNTIPSGNSEYSVFVVLRPLTTGLSVFLFSGNAATNEANGFYSGATSGTQFQNYWFTNAVTGGSFSSGTRILIEFTYAQNSFVYIYQNGVLQASNALSGRNSGTGNNFIGGEVGRSIYSTCELNEIIVYRTNLRDTARQQVEGYLAAKWGLQSSLGGTIHPYTYGPPVLASPATYVSNLRLWLDAQDATAYTLSGSNVTAVRDKSSNAWSLGSASGFTLGTTRFNGTYPSFYGTGGQLGSNGSFTYTQPLTIYFVGQAITANASTFLFDGAGGGRVVIYAGAQLFAGGEFAATNRDAAVSSPHVMAAVVNGSSSSIVLNGTTTTGNPGTNGFGGIRISSRNTGGDPYIGHICELLIYSGAHVTSEIQTMMGYLAWKWGIPSRLGVNTHPFRRYRALTPVFAPNQLAGCALWLDAADATTLTLSGSNVTAWADKANGVVMTTQGTLANITRTQSGINGYPSVYLNNAASDAVYLSGTLSNQLTGTAFYVIKAYSQRTVNWRPFLTWFNDAQFPAYGYLGNTTVDTVGPYTTCASPNGTPTQVLTAGSNYIISYGWSGTTTTVTTNGSAAQTGSQQAYSSSTSTLWLGADGTGASERITLEYGELLFFSNVLTTTQRQQVEGYLAWKWGLLPSLGGVSHPFRTGPAMVLPTQISGCQLWLDAADATSMTLSGSNVTQWRDKSVNGHAGTSTGSPVRTTVDGYDAVTFNGSSQYFNFGDVLDLGTNHLNIFVVSKFNTTANGSILAKSSFGGAGRYSLLRDNGNILPLLQNSAGATGQTGPSDTNTARRLLTWTWDRATQALYQNGGITPVSSVILPETTSLNTSYPFLVGTYNAGDGGLPPTSSYYFNGSINEIVGIYGTMTTAQRQQVEGYLAWKWGLQASLPSPSHPYRGFKP